ncbi:CBS domain-containing protein, partial [Dolichospermum sp. ST_sed3]|nr:CBS domain-containing protein [Dolichospermum sp. ST_sed3]
CLDIGDPVDVLMEKISSSIHSYFPIFKGDIDEIVGVVSIKHLFSLTSKNLPIDLSSIMQEPLFIPERMAALKLLGKFKSSGKHFAVVIDEYGGLSGVVTAIDLLESIVGDLPSEHGRDSDSAVAREDGSWLVDGIILIEDLSDYIPVRSHSVCICCCLAKF